MPRSHSSATPTPPRKSTSPTPITSSSSSNPTSTSNSTTATKRLLQELTAYAHSPTPSVLLHLGPTSDSNLLHWEAVLKGPPPSSSPSPYTHGLWLLTLLIPPTYPHTPPHITFSTPICHPNIHFATGEICLTLLTAEHWSPAYTLAATLAAIQQLLREPVVDSPLNVDIANLYREGDAVGAEALVRFWVAERRWRGEGEGGWISGQAFWDGGGWGGGVGLVEERGEVDREIWILGKGGKRAKG